MGQGVSLGEASQELLRHVDRRVHERNFPHRQSQPATARRYFLQKVKLGEGSFGTVWRAVDRPSSAKVAHMTHI